MILPPVSGSGNRKNRLESRKDARGIKVGKRAKILFTLLTGFLGGVLGGCSSQMAAPSFSPDLPQTSRRGLERKLSWNISPPLVSPAQRPEDPCHAVKDPTVVRFHERWHLFCTIRSRTRTHQIEYLSFSDWKEANAAERHVLKITDGYSAAPQIFFFAPHQKWYLIYQIIDPSRDPQLQPAFSTTQNLADPSSWSGPARLFAGQPKNVRMWIDFWVICDLFRAHLFFTALNGEMWHSDTQLSDFPFNWSTPKVVLHGDIYEASHTYRLKKLKKYLTLVEARYPNGGRRYYKAYVADRLDGAWQSLSATKEEPFASWVNCRDTGPHWTDSFSHGELLREGFDQTLEVDPGHLKFLFQGASDQDRAGKTYGEIPWRLGMLTPIYLPK